MKKLPTLSLNEEDTVILKHYVLGLIGNTIICPHCKQQFIPDHRMTIDGWNFMDEKLFGNKPT
jgi:hypothetical protein